jgi:hypothetical protein
MVLREPARYRHAEATVSADHMAQHHEITAGPKAHGEMFAVAGLRVRTCWPSRFWSGLDPTVLIYGARVRIAAAQVRLSSRDELPLTEHLEASCHQSPFECELALT